MTVSAARATMLSLAVLASACAGSPAYVRGSEMQELDEYAMSTGLDRKDLEQLFDANWDSLAGAGIMGRWEKAADKGGAPSIAIFPIVNETSEHIDSQLDTLLSKIETRLVNTGYLSVISRERQKQMVEELRVQTSAAFDPSKAGQLGRQIGVGYFVTGKVSSASEQSTGGEVRVQYSLFMQVIEVETSGIRWQNEASLTKGLVRN